MPKIRLDDLDGYRPSKEKVQRRKKENYEEFQRGHDKRNKRVKKRR
jgi:hypothetical protein|tara:strand:- start:4798 stop:4935 length:138 start_codon:yes stop_codon:yes gene_type:complete